MSPVVRDRAQQALSAPVSRQRLCALLCSSHLARTSISMLLRFNGCSLAARPRGEARQPLFKLRIGNRQRETHVPFAALAVADAWRNDDTGIVEQTPGEADARLPLGNARPDVQTGPRRHRAQPDSAQDLDDPVASPLVDSVMLLDHV